MLLLSLRRWLWQKKIYIYIFFNSLLQSLRRDPEKQIMIFYLLLLHWLRRCSDAKYIYCFAVNTTLHCAMIMTKINYLSFQHCFHYTFIMRVKYCFPIATTFTTRWSRQKINFFSFQNYFHYTTVMRIKLLHNYHEKKLQYPLRKFSVSKTFEHNTIDSPSGISVECSDFFP